MEYKNLNGGKASDKIAVYNCDCMDLLKQTPDNYYELSIVDPPYGIDIGNDARNGLMMKTAAAKRKDYKKKDWDKGVPTDIYFKELMRVSKHQIIWGVNYYPYNFLCGGRIYWDKCTAKGYTNSDGELAFCSKINSIKSISIMWNGMLQHDMKNKEVRIHPTQKPVKLYEWLLMNYAKEGDKIVDTHRGSASLDIACHNLGFDLVTCEIDTDYFNDGNKRLEQHQQQLTMF